MGYAHEYARSIMWRGRVPMEPADFVPDWADRPRKGKHFPGVASVALPVAPRTPGLLQDGVHGSTAEDDGAAGVVTPDLLAALLRESYGLLGRRLGVQANTDLAALPLYHQANFGRGAASGGGLYPISVYLVNGPGGWLPPGVHHYDTARHRLDRVLVGDVTADVRAALPPQVAQAAAATDHYLVLAIDLWKNAFKYNSFCYHAITMDVGALLQTWRMQAAAAGVALRPGLWFDEPLLTGLLGLGEREGVFAVVPLPVSGAHVAPDAPAAMPAQRRSRRHATARVRHHDSEKSLRVLDFPILQRIHDAASSGGDGTLPGADRLDGAVIGATTGPQTLTLPPPVPLPGAISAALRARRSSFGRFSAGTPMSAEHLSTVLAAGATGQDLPLDVLDRRDGTPRRRAELVAQYVFVNHVDQVPPGAYRYDPAAGALTLVRPGPSGDFLQHNYFLSNYNVEQAAAVVVPAVRTLAVLDAVGDRGYRLVNALVGATCQAFYTAAGSLGLGCGVALGVDSVSFVEELGLAERGEFPLMIMMAGHERPRPADYRYDLG